MTNLPYQYEYPRPAVAVDLIVLRPIKDSKQILLIERKNNPFQGCWALPGGFLDENETLEQGAARELMEETGVRVENSELKQLKAYSDPKRDPRTRVISVVFHVAVPSDTDVIAGDDAAQAKWYSVDSLPKLAFDHDQIVREWLFQLPGSVPEK